MCQTVLIVTIGLSVFFNSINCLPLYGEIESDLDTTKQSIVRANQILASINRDVDLCLSNSIACTLKSYDDLDDQTFDSINHQQSGSNSYSSGSNGDSNLAPTTTGYSEADEGNVTLSPTLDSTGRPLLSMYGRVPTIKIVVPPSSDQKFTHVLDDLDSLEVHVQSAITNFTTTRRFTYTAMLKPMLKHIHQLRNNLSLLHNRLIGVAALTNIASQVNELTDHISDALVGGNDVQLDDYQPPSPISSSTSTSTSPSSSSSITTTSTTTTTTPTPSTTNHQQTPTTINSQSSSVLVETSSTTNKASPTVSPSSPSNPTTINESIVETTTKAMLGLPEDNVDEIATIKPIN